MKYLAIFAAMSVLGAAPAWAQGGGAGSRPDSRSPESVSDVPGSSTGVVVGVNPGDRLPPSLAGTTDTTSPGGPSGSETPTAAPTGGGNAGAKPDRYPLCDTHSQDRCGGNRAR